MPKKIDAFAFRDFDKDRILARKYFDVLVDKNGSRLTSKEFTDDEIGKKIAQIFVMDLPNIDVNTKELSAVKQIADRLMSFYDLIERHIQRLSALCVKICEVNEKRDNKKLLKLERRIRILMSVDYPDFQEEVLFKQSQFVKTAMDMETELNRFFFGQRLKETRIKMNLSQREFAEKSGFNQTDIALYERGKKFPSVNNLIRLARFTSKTTDYLVGLS